MSQFRLNRTSRAESRLAVAAGVPPNAALSDSSAPRFLGQDQDFWSIRLALVSATVVLCYTLGPFGFHGLPAAGLGFFVAMVILLAELRLRHAEISGLVGGAVGAVLGLLAAVITLVSHFRASTPKSFFEFTSLFALGYLGLAVGSRKARDIPHIPLPRSVEAPRRNPALSLSRRRHHGCGGRRPPSHQSHRGDPRNFHPPDTGRKDDLRPPGRSFRSGIAPSRRSHNRPGQPRVKRGQWPRFLAPRSRSSVEFFSLFRIRSCLVATPSEEFLFHPVLEVNSGFCNRA